MCRQVPSLDKLSSRHFQTFFFFVPCCCVSCWLLFVADSITVHVCASTRESRSFLQTMAGKGEGPLSCVFLAVMPKPRRKNNPCTKATSQDPPPPPRPATRPPGRCHIYPLAFFYCSFWHQTAQSRFAEIAEAYEVLSEESSRQLYDHARRVRAAHDDANANRGGGGLFGGGGGSAAGWEVDPEWYYADGMDWDGFGSSFGGGAAGGGGGGFGAAFGRDPFAGGGGGGGVHAHGFPRSDPMVLFEVCVVSASVGPLLAVWCKI